MTAYVDAVMGSRFVQPMPFDLGSCFADSTAATPLVFVLSPGADPMANLLKFAEQKGPMRVEAVSLGQGQGPVAQRWVDEGCTQGFWVVLQNCHLAKSFMPQLESLCESQIKATSVHKDFRLWLTSYPSEIFPITARAPPCPHFPLSPLNAAPHLLRRSPSPPPFPVSSAAPRPLRQQLPPPAARRAAAAAITGLRRAGLQLLLSLRRRTPLLRPKPYRALCAPYERPHMCAPSLTTHLSPLALHCCRCWKGR